MPREKISAVHFTVARKISCYIAELPNEDITCVFASKVNISSAVSRDAKAIIADRASRSLIPKQLPSAAIFRDEDVNMRGTRFVEVVDVARNKDVSLTVRCD